MSVDSVAMVQRSAAAMSQVLENATTAQVDLAKKMTKMNVEMALSSEPGKGGCVDCIA